MGIKTVAIYSEPDATAVHTRMADEAYCVGPAASAQSYLNVPRIVEVLKESGAQAVHPGYGFLSENASFVKTLDEIGVTFIGPRTKAIHAMGDKIESKKLAEKAGVSVIPGFLGEVHNDEEVIKIANEIGYPVMLKASAGGGGKGMRIAWNDAEAVEGFKISKREAQASFGDDRMLIEKFIDNPRHIEIQILADGKGNTIYLNERECSIQRRNQKVVEEAPSPFITPEVREQMGKQAVALSNAVEYQSAGTVEMLVDSARNFYFLEMNTRLQVEHPITEYITGVDIVEHMIRVAAGERLSINQEDVQLKGWAVESRVYAEDPYRNFLPSTGTLTTYEEPDVSSGNVRVDSGITEGSEISMFYDPMICKLVSYGEDRPKAIETMRHALDTYRIAGVQHNIPFLRSVMDNKRFQDGNISTKFIEEEYPKGFEGYSFSTTQIESLICAAAVIRYESCRRANTISQQLGSLSEDIPSVSSMVINVLGKNYDVEFEEVDDDSYGQAKISFFNTSHDVNYDWQYGKPTLSLQVDSSVVSVQVLEEKHDGFDLQFCGTKLAVKAQTAIQKTLGSFMPEIAEIDYSNFLMSPMPGKIISLDVAVGDSVTAGQQLAVMEAMKMQNVLRAESDAVVKSIEVKAGDNVSVDAVIIEFESKSDNN
eukprot:CAMPEP_0117015212 /NCGR_PEP_ID=MMETSP0472-20121206/12194_1 /TAXON_ID=693140 ORGANISM="Tiarina fusus, Strain LIS" /NCGR_SAMPLE_ID=MMETSP0472 /ASSEMBLY_ACC=CAM_ASM_000603 /LENGTH=652 /DNA_ID=CAMNT_0004718959 /DNA_START=171 /DNA_END=2127 /DNA_ORIENTATION=+